MNILPEPYDSIRRACGLSTTTVMAGLVAIWSIPGLLAGGETYVFSQMADRPLPVWRAFAGQLPGWLTFALLTPVLLRFDRFTAAMASRLARLSLHVLGALVIGVSYAIVAAVAWRLAIGSPLPFLRLSLQWLLSSLPSIAISYLVMIGGGRAVYWFWQHRESSVSAARLETQLSRARLSALRAQLNPHFFFNCLNTATVLVRSEDMAEAERVLGLMGELMRETLRQRERTDAHLRDEIAFSARYLEIERVRFSDRLRVTIDIEEGLDEAVVPLFLLQPLVENAMRHGIARRPAAGQVVIRARRVGAMLNVVVEDDGPGPNGEGSSGAGLGLSATRERLVLMHGENAHLSLEEREGGGAVVNVTLPLVFGEER